MNTIGLFALLLSIPLPPTLAPAPDEPVARAIPLDCDDGPCGEPYDGFPFSEELSVAEAYNRLYATRYDPRTRTGLARLRKDHGSRFGDRWNIDLVKALRLVAYDTAGSAPIRLGLPDGRRIEVIPSLPWTAPTRGWMPGGGAIIDLEALLRRHGVDPEEASFQILVGEEVITPGNAFMLEGKRRGEALLCFNESGVDGADADGNEPILQLFSWAAEDAM